MKSLASLKKGHSAVIEQVGGNIEGIQRRRLLDLGIVPGASILYRYEGPVGSTRAFEVYGSLVALRREQYDQIFITQTETEDV